ncbi:hypothetical protein AX774_g5384, partial [Zancudomyces culisetae]
MIIKFRFDKMSSQNGEACKSICKGGSDLKIGIHLHSLGEDQEAGIRTITNSLGDTLFNLYINNGAGIAYFTF